MEASRPLLCSFHLLRSLSARTPIVSTSSRYRCQDTMSYWVCPGCITTIQRSTGSARALNLLVLIIFTTSVCQLNHVVSTVSVIRIWLLYRHSYLQRNSQWSVTIVAPIKQTLFRHRIAAFAMISTYHLSLIMFRCHRHPFVMSVHSARKITLPHPTHSSTPTQHTLAQTK